MASYKLISKEILISDMKDQKHRNRKRCFSLPTEKKNTEAAKAQQLR